jgi:hypothetical protein
MVTALLYALCFSALKSGGSNSDEKATEINGFACDLLVILWVILRTAVWLVPRFFEP